MAQIVGATRPAYVNQILQQMLQAKRSDLHSLQERNTWMRLHANIQYCRQVPSEISKTSHTGTTSVAAVKNVVEVCHRLLSARSPSKPYILIWWESLQTKVQTFLQTRTLTLSRTCIGSKRKKLDRSHYSGFWRTCWITIIALIHNIHYITTAISLCLELTQILAANLAGCSVS